MSREQKFFILPLALIAIIISTFWLITRQPIGDFVSLIVGLGIGSFFLDIDHIVYWLIVHPELEESKLAKLALKRGEYKSLYRLYKSTKSSHKNLIFHHINFHLVLLAVSLFVFTSSESIFAKSFVFALNFHLVSQLYQGYQASYSEVSEWYFARNTTRIPEKYFKILLFALLSLMLAFVVLLGNS